MDGEAGGPQRLQQLTPGMPIVYGGDRVSLVDDRLAAAFQPGDRLLVDPDSGALLHVLAVEHQIATRAVDRAQAAFARMGGVSDTQITAFFDAFAARLSDDAVWGHIAGANADDVTRAAARGRSTTRLKVSDAMRRDMVDGLTVWRDAEPSRGRVIERLDHAGWSVEQVTAPLGVVGFVFEGRPNVFADATGVLRAGNTVVFRIGSDALATAKAIVEHALDPAIRAAGLPDGAAVLIESAAHAAGWAMFADARLALAVARGSGPAVAQLGAIARAAGTPVSLHGTGGAWMVADASANADRFFAAAYHSLDRKVCNTLNVCCIVRERADDLIPVFLEALERAGERRRGWKLHVAEVDLPRLPSEILQRRGPVVRAGGVVEEGLVEPIADAMLGLEWEWEETPEVSLKIVESIDEAAALFNALSPRFCAALIAEDAAAQARFYEAVDAPFVSDGFTRWVDGQYALSRPELGLSNWENGRLFARGGVLAGDGVFSVRTRVIQADLELDRGGAPTPVRGG
ncbi:aldehyde dehydrogenase family protein [Phenylobacterium immobile]|uniref:aldehyde dehydrogenase family protein n=1 Tax=Phenylobacterium immobile TaxID=21 RepID=UPI000A6BE916|nr:aldehyde dehydrogenase family protein [Phenylobacterium immobile]